MEASTMVQASPDNDASLPEERRASQAVVLARVEGGTAHFALTTEVAGLPRDVPDDTTVWLLALDLFDDGAQLVISRFTDTGWFTAAEVLARVPLLPLHGAGRAARRREERGQ
jgi:hypothetical protein